LSYEGSPFIPRSLSEARARRQGVAAACARGAASRRARSTSTIASPARRRRPDSGTPSQAGDVLIRLALHPVEALSPRVRGPVHRHHGGGMHLPRRRAAGRPDPPRAPGDTDSRRRTGRRRVVRAPR